VLASPTTSNRKVSRGQHLPSPASRPIGADAGILSDTAAAKSDGRNMMSRPIADWDLKKFEVCVAHNSFGDVGVARGGRLAVKKQSSLVDENNLRQVLRNQDGCERIASRAMTGLRSAVRIKDEMRFGQGRVKTETPAAAG